jgi:hypothetical protein
LVLLLLSPRRTPPPGLHLTVDLPVASALQIAVKSALDGVQELKNELKDLTVDVSEKTLDKLSGEAGAFIEAAFSQRALGVLVSKRARASLLASLPPRERARVGALAAKGCAAWMLATPGECSAFSFSSLQDVVSSRRRLGVPILAAGCAERRCPSCVHRPVLDNYHLEVCMMGGCVLRVHNRLNEGVVRMHSEAGLYGVVGARGLFTGRAVDAKPVADGYAYGADVTYVIDTTVRNPLCHVAASCEDPLAAAKLGEKRKEAVYAELVREHGFSLLPAAFLTSGGFGPQLDAQIVKMAKRWAGARPADERAVSAADFKNYWRTFFSCVLHKAVANKVAAHCAYLRSPLGF